jgi:ABC-type multidrug transport system fused ATPase/permease subunit
MNERLGDLLKILTLKEKKYIVYLLFFMVIMAFFDVLGVASILPFMALIANHSLVHSNKYIFFIYNLFHFKNINTFLIYFGLFVFLFFSFSIFLKIFTTYYLQKFVLMREYSISSRLIRGYINQPYTWFLNRNSSDLEKVVLSEVSQVVHNGILPLLHLISNLIVVIFFISLLVFVNPLLALYIFVFFGFSFGMTYFIFKKKLIKAGNERLKGNEERFMAISELFGAFKEIKYKGLYEFFVKKFESPAHTYAKKQLTAQLYSGLPRFFIEGIAFGGVILMILVMMTKEEDFLKYMPILTLYVLTGYRMMPALQQVFSNLNTLNYSGSSIKGLLNELNQFQTIKVNRPTYLIKIPFNNQLRLSDISFSYPNYERLILSEININIPAKKTIAFVGGTGSGKTTIIDIILGLLEPQGGKIFVDDMLIETKNRDQWQQSIGYVPQQIFISDSTIASNIAFGIDLDKIDHNLVEQASRVANLHDFIISELPQKYDTIVGEQGVRLSGGQRQRIGIARALYLKPDLLIFDEATSALDTITEQVVMDAIKKLSHSITIIIVAHRLSTVRDCDLIYLIDKGIIMDSGTYDELYSKNELFRNLASS